MLRGLLVQGVNELGSKKLELSRWDSIPGTPLQTAHESDPRRCYVAVDRVVGVLWLSVQTQGAAWVGSAHLVGSARYINDNLIHGSHHVWCQGGVDSVMEVL